MLHPSFFFDVVEIDEATRVGVSMCGSEDASSSKLKSLFNLQVVAVLRVEHSISKCLTRSDTKEVSSKPSAIRVDVVQRWAFLCSNSSDHCSHRQAHTFVGIDQVRKNLRSCGDGYAAFVSEFV